jgi:hypothetical protein
MYPMHGIEWRTKSSPVSQGWTRPETSGPRDSLVIDRKGLQDLWVVHQCNRIEKEKDRQIGQRAKLESRFSRASLLLQAGADHLEA